MGSDAAKAQNPETELQRLREYIEITTRAGRPGVSVIGVFLHELRSAWDMDALAVDLENALVRRARDLGARTLNLSGRLIVLIPPQNEWDITQVVYDVRMLVLKTVGRQASQLGMNPASFTRVFHTRRQGEELEQIARNAIYGHDQLRAVVAEGGSLASAHIEALEERVTAVGALTFMREFAKRQAIARIRRGYSPEERGREIFIGMKDLQRQLFPGVRLTENRNLFKELTLRLDQLVLRGLGESPLLQGSVSINLNVRNVLTDEFERVAQRLAERDNTELWIELDVADVMAHIDDFRDAQKVLRRHKVFTFGDNVSPDLVPAVEGAALGLDGYKLAFPRESASLDDLEDAIRRAQAAKRPSILTRVEDEPSIELGQSLGVIHFQGFYIDHLLSGRQSRDQVESAGL